MVYSLVHYPVIEMERIDRFRRNYDPQFGLIRPHITIMFPLTESISEDKLVDHLQNILSEIEPFPIHLRGLQKSVDDYLFLLVDQGKEDIVDLHMRVYSELLENRRRSSLRYVPHLTLGDFSNKLDEYPQALAEAKQLDLNYRCMLDRLDLLKLHDEPRQIVWSKQFEIG